MSKSSLEAAAEAAAKVNAMLIAKGKLKLSTSQIKPKIGNNVLGRAKGGDLVTAEIDINDAPLSARNLLTRGHMQDEICKDSGAAISTRGRYMTPEERQNIATPECRPLYLNLQASDYRAVKIAVRKILEIIDHHVTLSGKPKSPTVGVVTYPSTGANGIVNAVPNHQNSHIPSGTHFVQDKVFVGLEQAPPDYPVRDKILGPAGSFLQHIRTETGATVTLRGKGSGFIEPTSGREAFEPLYIHITHPKPEGLQAAKALAINLVETAHVEFATWQQTQQSVLQPLTSVVLPQPAPVAYQNQVVVTPTVLPGALPAGTGVVATGIQIPSSVPGTMTAGIPSLMHANVPTLVSPVSVASIVPVSVQAIPSQTVITYPTYVASTAPVIARSAAPVLTRQAAPAVSIFGVVPTLPAAAAYTAARPRTPFQIQPVVYTNLTPQTHLAQPVQQTPTSMVMTITEPTNYPITSRYMQLSQMQSEMAKHRYYGSIDVSAVNRIQPNCLQESNVNHPTELHKVVAPFIAINTHARVMIAVTLCAMSFIITSFSVSHWMTFLGVICAALSSGLGEVTFLSYSSFFDKNVVSTWASGTGGAGVIGALSYASLKAFFDTRPTLQIMLVMPVITALTFWILIRHPQSKRLNCRELCRCSAEAKPILEGEIDMATKEYVRKPSSYTLKEKISLTKPLLKYMLPLGLVYFAEYFINQGLMELLYFKNASNWLCHKVQYRWYQVDYQVGVLISRSSVNILKVNKLWILPILQFINVIFLLFNVYYAFLPNIWIVFAIIFYEGLLGGCSYVNTFYKITVEVAEKDREFSMGVASVGDSVGIALAGIVSLPVHEVLCKLPAYM